MLKVSIITACLNNASTIESTMQSVFSQDYPNIEYIVIDGVSTDGTLDIIDKYKSKISAFVSEKDKGIYYALNKGLDRATGDVVGFLHADDFYPNKDTISKVVKAFETNNVECVYGDLQYVDRENPAKIVRNWKSEPYYVGIFLKGFMPPHPSFFMKKKWYDAYGKFSTEFTISADYELMLRMLHKHKLSVHYIPEVLTKMRTGGESNKSLSNRIRANKEDRKAYLRDVMAYRNSLLVEQLNGDFGMTMVRQLLFTAFNYHLQNALLDSTDERLRSIAEKAIKETTYHLRHCSDWIIRLGDGTEESHKKVQDALEIVWMFTDDLFVSLPGDKLLVDAKITPDLAAIKIEWLETVKKVCTEGTLTMPKPDYMMKGGRTGNHSEHLGFILAEMQFLQRSYPDAKW